MHRRSVRSDAVHALQREAGETVTAIDDACHYTFESETEAAWPPGPDHFAEALRARWHTTTISVNTKSPYRPHTFQVLCTSGRALKVLADRQWVQVEGHREDCEEFTEWFMGYGYVPLDTKVLRDQVDTDAETTKGSLG